MKRLASTLFLLGAIAIAPSAFAEGVLLAPGDLPESARAALLAEVTAARRTDPDTFASVASLRNQLPELDERKRGRLATVTPALLGLGKRAVPAMLSELAVDGSRGSLSDSAWLAWRIDLLEAIGGLRDPRAAAVLERLIEAPLREFLLVRAAATALGKLNTQAAATRLVAASRAGAARQRLAILSGMGHCRRTLVAHRLAEALSLATRGGGGDPRAVKHLARALGDVGSAWAWQTLEVRATGEEASVRATAAEALVEAYREIADAAASKVLVRAILVVDDPSTKARIAAARDRATPDQRARLDELERRVDRNPLH
ncbi:MAG: hypothetical protein FJ096_09755 [Deltaproteobacteria bacterium]|nr:hypothetical protein [Deltaproteobacteria bacterium]